MDIKMLRRFHRLSSESTLLVELAMPLIITSPDPDTISLLITSQGNSYLIVSLGALVAYDYVLCLGQEVDLIWKRKLTWISWCYASLRYMGLLYALATAYDWLPSQSLTDKTCSLLHVIVTLSVPYVLEAILQGVMTACVCVFYKSTRNVLTCVYVGFLLVHLLTAALNIMEYLPPYGLSSQEAVYLGVTYCIALNPTSDSFLGWLNPVDDGISLGLEMILFLMMLYRSIWHLRECRLKNPACQFKSVAQLIFQQGLLYFVWYAVGHGFELLVSSTIIDFSPLAMAVLSNIESVLQMMLLCMLGPWFILSIRGDHEDHVKGGPGLTMQAVSAIAFRRVNLSQANADEGGDVMLIGREQQEAFSV